MQPESTNERVLWKGRASWSQFAWLYLIAAMTAFRAALFMKLGLPGWEMWALGTGVLLLCAAGLRSWTEYGLTTARVLMKNTWTGKEMQSIALADIGDLSVKKGLIADLMGIGTVAITSANDEKVLNWQGVFDPEDLKERIAIARRRG